MELLDFFKGELEPILPGYKTARIHVPPSFVSTVSNGCSFVLYMCTHILFDKDLTSWRDSWLDFDKDLVL